MVIEVGWLQLALQVVQFAWDASKNNNAEKVVKRRQNLINILEYLQFDDDGIMPVLRRIAETNVVIKSDSQKLLQFVQDGPRVNMFLNEEIEEYISDKENVRYSDRMILSEIAKGKRTIRGYFRSDLNSCITMGELVDKPRFEKLVSEIDEFNTIIRGFLDKLRDKQPDTLA